MAKGDRGKRIAVDKGALSDKLNAIGNGYGSNLGQTREGIGADHGHALTHIQLGKPTAQRKGVAIHQHHAVRQRHRGQPRAVGKGLGTNVGGFAAKGHRAQLAAVGEGVCQNLGHALGDHQIPGQQAAACKSTVTDIGQPFREGDRGQIRAVGKGKAANALDVVSKCYAGDVALVKERFFTDRGHRLAAIGVGNHDVAGGIALVGNLVFRFVVDQSKYHTRLVFSGKGEGL